jgi:hypothetical protein
MWEGRGRTFIVTVLLFFLGGVGGGGVGNELQKSGFDGVFF